MEKQRPQSHSPVAVIGMGCLFPKSPGAKSYWRLIHRGEDAITEIPSSHWSPSDYFSEDPKTPDHVYCTRGGFLSPVDFDPSEFGIPPNVLEATDTSQLLSLLVAKMAMEDAGYDSSRTFDRDRTSVIIGITGTQELVIPLGARLGHPKWRKAIRDAGIDPDTTEEIIQRIGEEYVPWQENSFPGLLGNVVSGRICNRLDFGGTNCVVDAACASSMGAIHLSLMELSTHHSDMVLTGGADTINDIFMHMCFSRTGILSKTGNAKPFSEDADGTVLGEGIGMVVLKRLEDAEADGDRIYAVIRGIGTSSDGKSQSIYAPRAEGQAKALNRAYQSADIDPQTVELLETHGTGTRVGDKVEVEALKMVFDQSPEKKNSIAFGSVKSMIGHSKAAAGAAGLIKTVLALYNKVLPPTLKINRPDPLLDLNDSALFVNTETLPWISTGKSPRRAGVSAFGFGGSNYHMVLEEYQREKTSISWDGSVEIFAFSDDSIEKIDTRLQSLSKNTGSELSGEDIARFAEESRHAFSSDHPFRLLFTFQPPLVSPGKQLADRLQTVRKSLSQQDCRHNWQESDIFFGAGKESGSLAFVFPGQGSQYVGMGRDFTTMFPAALSRMEAADKALGDDKRISSAIYPSPALNPDEKRQQEETLRSTDTAQPAIGAISAGITDILYDFGVLPDAVCGHSYGELTALRASGRISDEDFHRLSEARGRLMAEASRKASDGNTGAMMAVKGPLEKLDALAAEFGDDIILANRNSPMQGVFSGSVHAVERMEKRCKENGFDTVRLPVSAAFHSPFVSAAAEPFFEEIKHVQITEGRIPVYANTTAAVYPENREEAQRLLANQLANPVNFIGCIQNITAAGCRTFVEVGPKAVLSGLIRAIFPDEHDVQVIPLDMGPGKKSGVIRLATCLCHLASLGFPVTVTNWELPAPAKKAKRMSIPISGANYRTPRQATMKKSPAPKTVNPAKRPATMPAPAKEPHMDKPADRQKPVQHLREKTMKKTAYAPSASSQQAMQTIREAMQSLQVLQNQTADAHKRFLDNQTENSRALQNMMEKAAALAGLPMDSQRLETPGETTNLQPPQPVQPLVETPPAAVPETTVGLHPDHLEPVAVEKPAVSNIETEPQPDRAISDSQSRLESTLLSVVAELTGYPEEMLDADMDIEADLGIDSIKRVEILSTLEERMPHLPTVSPDVMGGMKTLREIISVMDGSANTANPAATSQTAPATKPVVDSQLESNLLSVVAELTGYPEEMLDADMDIEADLGIDSIKRVEILSTLEERMPHLPTVSPDVMGGMKTLREIISAMGQGADTESPATATQPAPETDAGTDGLLESTLLSVVAELTGYPEEMLDADMDIEADLGIDSIKRVEILSTLEERMPHLPSVAPDVMGSLKTLGEIVAYMNATVHSEKSEAHVRHETIPEKQPPASAPRNPVDTQKPDALSANESDLPERRIIALKECKAPESANRLPSDLPFWITDDGTDLSTTVVAKLAENGVAAEIIDRPRMNEIISGSQLPPKLAGLAVLFPPQAEDPSQELENALMLAKAAAPSLSAAANDHGSPVFATVTRMDGAFGFHNRHSSTPESGGLAGLAKTAAIEWESVVCKALDLSPQWPSTKTLATTVAKELLAASREESIEIGLSPDSRIAVETSAAPSPDGEPSLTPEDVIVVTGGGRGITADVSAILSARYRCTFILLGRSPQPVREPAWLSGVMDPAAMKKAILKNEFGNKKTAPTLLEASFRKHSANREIAATLEKIESNGGKADYYSVDVRDQKAIQAVFESLREKHGPVSGLIHGAGTLEDRFIVDKTAEHFRKVYDTKVEGLKNLLLASTDDPVKYLVLFSSVTARYGNKGQADYAMANEALNKIAGNLSNERPGCRVLSINWGPWDGGMVTPSLKREFTQNGISLISLQAGAQCLIREMAGDEADCVEVVIGAGLDSLKQTKETAEDKPADDAHRWVTFRREIDLDNHPVLESHVLDGRPVVPFALMGEWLGHGALHDNPGLVLHGLDDWRMLNGIVLPDAGSRLPIRLMAGKARKSGSVFEVDVDLRNGTDRLHARARAILCSKLPQAPVIEDWAPLAAKPYTKSIDEAYDDILFHGPSLRGIREITGWSSGGMVAKLTQAPPPSKWISEPLRGRWIADPLVLDCAFQMSILWCFEEKGMVSLPSYAASYRQFKKQFPADGVTAILKVKSATDAKMQGDFFFADEKGEVVAQLSGFEAAMNPSLFKAFKRKYAA